MIPAAPFVSGTETGGAQGETCKNSAETLWVIPQARIKFSVFLAEMRGRVLVALQRHAMVMPR